MIADLDRTIEKLLIEEMPVKNGEIDIKFDQPKREWSARLSRPTVNLFLYDVRENNVLRQHQWEKINGMNGRPLDRATMKRSPYRVDCCYMLTTWASEPQDEHRLLTRAMLSLFRHPLIPQERLVGEMENQPFPIQARLASHDRLTNPAEVWGSLDNEIRPSVSYTITIAMDPWAEITTPLVSTLEMHTGQAAQPTSQKEFLTHTETLDVTVGGRVLSDSQPVPDITVAIKDTGFVSTTDTDGQYKLGKLTRGDYTLIAWPKEGKPTEKTISIPQDNYDIEI